ncbi:TfoX/Sxy family protein [Daeguia caeni]|uniref:TfoX/Sxy family protein n=1 Tax=Daeguia caeni TaxID=439612 RepID=A0ABV9H5A9_9HYPH
MDDDTLHDLFQAFGPIRIKRMFGGKGIYHQGLIFALVIKDGLMFKADELSAPRFIEADCTQWSYQGHASKDGQDNKRVTMPYWNAPSEAFDDPEVMAEWARLAFEAALRSEKRSSAKKKKQ